jgi:rRNA maturation endonuclease Nob1
MSDIDPGKIAEWIALGKTGIESLKLAWNLLPKSNNKDEIEQNIAKAERAFAESNAKLAKELDYKLCQCTFPPQIMLWVQAEQAQVCKNCGHRIERPKPAKISPTWGHSRGR